MFTNNDFLNYFNQLEALERTMRDIYKQAMNSVKDPTINKFFEHLYIQETEHQNVIENIKEIVIKKFFADK